MPRQIQLQNEIISDDSLCYVIAEIGHNHQGNLETAKQMFHAAKYSGANAVKLQKRNNKVLYTKAMYDSPYDNENSYAPTYGTHRDALEFKKEDYLELQKLAKELELVLFATAFDYPSADFLQDLDMPMYKIASADTINLPLLKYVAKIGKPMILSTGGATFAQVRKAYDTIMPINSELAILQCTASYPAEAKDLNLNIITKYREMFPDCVIGLSDHQNGISMALVAYVLGARIVEKHFTLNRAWKGTDQAFSLEPAGLRKLTRDLRRAKEAMGDGEKKRLICEEAPLFKMSKKMVAAKNLASGHVLTKEDVAIKSPGDGLSPADFENVIGRKLKKDLVEEENILFKDLE